MKLVAVDIGGTHARFALAEASGGKVVSLGEAVTLKTAEHASFQTAWEDFGRQCHAQLAGSPLPRAAAIAIAGPVRGEVIKFTNNPWIIRPALVGEKLGVDSFVLVNDFEAVGHAVAQAGPEHFIDLCGPAAPLPAEGTISVIGPGTGLGVAHIWRGPLSETGGRYHVQATEGGHIDYAPLDSIEDAILARLRQRYRRVSVERVVSGPAIVDIYETLAGIEGRAISQLDDKTLWTLGGSGADSLAAAAVDRFCLSLGSVAGDIALAQGGSGVVIAGGLGLRIKDVLLRSGFAERFRAKGRFEALMASIPVKLITHPQPGLFGAAAAYARQHA
jgi:glucokinase